MRIQDNRNMADMENLYLAKIDALYEELARAHQTIQEQNRLIEGLRQDVIDAERGR